MIAEFLLDGDKNGPPKKSVKEFKERYPDGLEYLMRTSRSSLSCHALAYSGDLVFYFSLIWV